MAGLVSASKHYQEAHPTEGDSSNGFHCGPPRLARRWVPSHVSVWQYYHLHVRGEERCSQRSNDLPLITGMEVEGAAI